MALGAATSVLQTAGQNKAIAAQNKAQMQAHNNRVKLTTAKNRTKKAQALAALDESVGAAGRGFAKEQAFVNAEVAKMDFAKLAATLEGLQAGGKIAASGASGKTAERIQNFLQEGKPGMKIASTNRSMRELLQSSESNMENIAESANYDMARIAANSTPDIQPTTPTLQKKQSFLPGILTGIAGGIGKDFDPPGKGFVGFDSQPSPLAIHSQPKGIFGFLRR